MSYICLMGPVTFASLDEAMNRESGDSARSGMEVALLWAGNPEMSSGCSVAAAWPAQRLGKAPRCPSPIPRSLTSEALCILQTITSCWVYFVYLRYRLPDLFG